MWIKLLFSRNSCEWLRNFARWMISRKRGAREIRKSPTFTRWLRWVSEQAKRALVWCYRYAQCSLQQFPIICRVTFGGEIKGWAWTCGMSIACVNIIWNQTSHKKDSYDSISSTNASSIHQFCFPRLRIDVALLVPSSNSTSLLIRKGRKGNWT